MLKIFKTNKFDFASPMAGKLIPLSEVDDQVFSSKTMGDGFAILPENGKVFAPVTGVVLMIFPTNHAIGIKDKVGNEWLIHIGMDTVNLGGKGFTCHVKEGQKIKQGQLLVEFDYTLVNDLAPSLVTPIVLTNNPDLIVDIQKEGSIKALESDIISLR